MPGQRASLPVWAPGGVKGMAGLPLASELFGPELTNTAEHAFSMRGAAVDWSIADLCGAFAFNT